MLIRVRLNELLDDVPSDDSTSPTCSFLNDPCRFRLRGTFRHDPQFYRPILTPSPIYEHYSFRRNITFHSQIKSIAFSKLVCSANAIPPPVIGDYVCPQTGFPFKHSRQAV